jgi:CBS-domain-containing membrane protein
VWRSLVARMLGVHEVAGSSPVTPTNFSQNSFLPGAPVYTKAEDIMTKDPMTLDTSTDISAAVNFFLEKKISSVPVTSTLKEIEGQLTELVLVRMLILFQLQPEKYKKIAHCTDLLEPAVFVAPEDLFSTLMKAIMKSPSRRLLVRKEGRKILGIISPKDMLKCLVANRENAELVKP